MNEPVTASHQRIQRCLERPTLTLDGNRIYYRSIVGLESANQFRLTGVDIPNSKYTLLYFPCDVIGLYTAPDGYIRYVASGLLVRFPPHGFRGTDQYTVTKADPLRPCCMPYGNDGYIYYVYGSDLYRISPTFKFGGPELLAKGCATSPDVQAGFVIYGGTDKKIYKLAL